MTVITDLPAGDAYHDGVDNFESHKIQKIVPRERGYDGFYITLEKDDTSENVYTMIHDVKKELNMRVDDYILKPLTANAQTVNDCFVVSQEVFENSGTYSAGTYV